MIFLCVIFFVYKVTLSAIQKEKMYFLRFFLFRYAAKLVDLF